MAHYQMSVCYPAGVSEPEPAELRRRLHRGFRHCRRYRPPNRQCPSRPCPSPSHLRARRRHMRSSRRFKPLTPIRTSI